MAIVESIEFVFQLAQCPVPIVDHALRILLEKPLKSRLMLQLEEGVPAVATIDHQGVKDIESREMKENATISCQIAFMDHHWRFILKLNGPLMKIPPGNIITIITQYEYAFVKGRHKKLSPVLIIE